MIQPFEPFTMKYLERIIQMKRLYVVSQSYARGVNHFAEAHKIDLLFTEYDSKGEAKMHLNAVKHDKYAAIIDLARPEHKAKVVEMLQGEKYCLYWAVVRNPDELQKRITNNYKENIRRYINSQTTWRVKGDETVKADLETTFGELFINIKWRNNKLRIKFKDIERF